MFDRLRRPSPALVLALVALFAALAGGAYAAKKAQKNTVIAKSIKKNAVVRSKIRAGAVDSARIADGTIQGVDIADNAIPDTKLINEKVTSVKLGPTQKAGLTIGNWKVEMVTNGAGVCANIEITAGAKAGSAGWFFASAPVAAGATQSTATGGGSLTATPIGAITDDGTSGLNGAMSYSSLAGGTCVFSLALAGN
jgi:trimeric autotransporter adhesin